MVRRMRIKSACFLPGLKAGAPAMGFGGGASTPSLGRQQDENLSGQIFRKGDSYYDVFGINGRIAPYGRY